ncbi:MAG: serine/threonine-protein kinase, partial [Myxococcales bacterium]|nr:serine/threonine protein kinase [Polyangiaceae bacterium]MDW8250383.1 serine/threonine-protein kinase [Myxococcales bacterium]
EISPLRELERALDALTQLCLGARQRLDDRPADALPPMPAPTLSSAVDAVLRGADTDGLVFAVASAREELAMRLPPLLVDIVASALEPLMTLPVVASNTQTAPTRVPVEKPLPAWLPRRRTLGGFYVVRPLGSGAGGTVFVVRRIEDRHNEKAEHFALKVPDYDGNAARSLSEEQFLQLFREEATALLGLPAHPNLARFVTFDLAARPKPILVMELVEGLALERMLQAGKIAVQTVLEILDGVLAGLEAMHGAGIGHLDVKPSNVILRGGRTPVLVDFGLSGRQIRPGCATLPYGAPEVWGLHLEGYSPTPPPVDVYAAACMAFEMLTTHDLFDGPSEMAIISLHLHSDGWPEPLQRLRRDPGLAPLADALASALRRHPAQRSTATQLRRALRSLAGSLRERPWPLRLPSAA